MGKKAIYKKVSQPYTLDKHLDNTSSDRQPGMFLELKNYIPEKDILIVREGVTIMSFTPE